MVMYLRACWIWLIIAWINIYWQTVESQGATESTPVITTDPMDQLNIAQGSDVVFNVTLSGNDRMPAYYWQRNGGRSLLDTPNTYAGTRTANLQVLSVDNGDEGFYSVVVFVDGILLFSSSATLSVVPSCPILTNSPNGSFGPVTNRIVGTTLSFQCDPGFVSTGPMTATCMDTLMWVPDLSLFVCTPLPTDPPPTTTPPILCPPLQPPVNGRLVDYTPNTNSPVSTTVTFQCDDGLFPRDVMTTTCGASGQWDRNPADLVCRERPVNCSLPAEPRNGTILGYDNFNATVVEGTMLAFQCDLGLLLNGEMTITCTNAGEWSTDPDGLECVVLTISAPSPIGYLVLAVVLTLVLLIGLTIGVLVISLVVCKRIKKREVHDQPPPPPGPVYEEVFTPKENIELEKNLAYGPLRR